MPRVLLKVLLFLVVGVGALALLVRLVEPRFAFFPFAGETVTPESHGVAFTPLSIRTGDGETLRAWWLPHETPIAHVIYFHGNGGNLSLWSDVLVEVHAAGFGVLGVDYRGYGLSTGRPSEQGLYRDVEATLAEYEARFADPAVPVIYWGRSLGGTMAAYGARHRRPDGLVLEAAFHDAIRLVRRDPIMWVLSWFSSYRFDTARWAGSLDIPILVMHGDRDRIVPIEEGRALYEALGSPARQFVVLEGVDHNDPVRHPEIYWAPIRDFAGALRQGRPPRSARR
jgi:uncharacterized protein